MTDPHPPLRNILILDTETTGLEDSDVCIEVAVSLYSVPHAAVIRSFASLIHATENGAEAVNRIPVALLADAPKAESVWPSVLLTGDVDAVIAHNAAFDRRFVPAHVLGRTPWICSCHDLDWPAATKPGQSLIALALAHGLGVSHAHRAAVDVDLLGRLLTRIAETGTDLQTFLARGLRPKATFEVADRSFDAARNILAKANGFRWDDSKRWLRTMAIEDAAGLPFRVRQIEDRK